MLLPDNPVFTSRYFLLMACHDRTSELRFPDRQGIAVGIIPGSATPKNGPFEYRGMAGITAD